MKRKKTNKFIVMLGLILILVSILITCFESYKKYQSNKEILVPTITNLLSIIDGIIYSNISIWFLWFISNKF